ncbi:hypothetical protein [Sphingomonas jatrophae]|uniref:Uncharacterized protein n=1 Tax=Sphingomonas jatrophae TaxID=1166337 RepID=A0A1I6LSL4_9SPHN|nr:hypothetical protein SAMN05192580_3196 [Sphingomonas jatrophae]
MAEERNRLSDPDYAAFAWGRFRRLMRWMALVAALAAVLALAYLWNAGSPFTVALVIATIAGVAGSVLLGTALMGLVFLSSGTGHDSDVGTGE